MTLRENLEERVLGDVGLTALVLQAREFFGLFNSSHVQEKQDFVQ